MELSKFTDKFNKVEGITHTVEEVVAITNGSYNGTLAHDNINLKTLNVYTGSMLTGDKITNYILSTPSETPWKNTIRIYASVPTVYISYETPGDKVEAEDINNVQTEIIRTQQEVNTISTDINAVKNTVDTNKAIWNDKYTKVETDNKVSALLSSLTWKQAVANFAAIATTYPSPQLGWTVNAGANTYRYNGTAWENILTAIQKATTTQDGLMSFTDKIKVDNTSGTNTGDETTQTIKTKLGIASITTDGYITNTDFIVLLSKQDNIPMQDTKPLLGNIYDLWINTSTTPWTWWGHDGNDFVQMGGEGASGGSTTIEEWVGGKQYVADTNLVIFEFNLYRCKITNNDSTFNEMKWDRICGTVSLDAISLNGHIIDESTMSPGRVLVVNNDLEYEHGNITVVGVVGTDGNILSAIHKVSIAPGEETIINTPIVTDDKIMINVQEQVPGSTVIDTHVDFSDISKYSLQDLNKLLFSSNTVKLKNASYCVNNYKFEETTGTSCIDSKGTYNGTYVGTTSVTGSIGKARSFNGTSDYISFANQVIPIGKKSIRFKIKTTSTTNQFILTNNGNTQTSYGISISMNLGKISVSMVKNVASIYNLFLTSTTTVNDGNWHTVMFTWDGTTNTNSAKIYIDDILNIYGTPLSTETVNASYNLYIGKQANESAFYLNAQLDEIEIYNNVLDISNLNTNPTYLKTTGSSNFSLTTLSSFTTLTATVLTPTNTSVKCLFSVDNQVNWLYKDATGIHKYTGDLTIDWTSSNQWSEISTYFTNLPIETFMADLSSLGIVPVTLDFAFDLKTTDLTVTPSISPIILTYISKDHTEGSSYGRYDETTVTWGIKYIHDLLNPNESNKIGMKNLTNKTRIAIVNVITSIS